ncbi:MAG: DUF4450 domain-containing protein, partial [Muribaculaceae bacterium]|nr:DUF4450 domain-containing protein [Muribaculaceae bacterium]
MKQFSCRYIVSAATGILFSAAVFAAPAARPLHYRPDGTSSVVAVNGTVKFNRALYGAHSGFRMECSDMPEFGIYLPRMGGNLLLTLPKGDCVARYTPGRMDYSQGGVEVEAQVLRSDDAALWAIRNTTCKPVEIGFRFGGVAEKKFWREGDLGVDDPTCFDLKPEYCKGNTFTLEGDTVKVGYGAKERKTLVIVAPLTDVKINDLPAMEGSLVIPAGETRHIALFPPASKASADDAASLMARAEAERQALVGGFNMATPDPWLNPVGGALAIAADGIWSGEAWLHGAIGWRTPHLGWRGAYVGDALGWHDRARTHFNTYASNQVTDIPPVIPQPNQDSVLNLARAEKRWGTSFYSDGYICRRPGKMEEMSHYDMNMVYADALLRHFRHTGDTAAMRAFWPVIKRHLAWEKRNFDPDGDHLYDAYCCIWASDALYYNGGAVTHSSAYNHFANKLAAQVAEAIGEDPAPYKAEAEAIKAAIDSVLWIDGKGHWAEYKDLMGLGRVHDNAALWTIYHAIDSEVADPLKSYAATCYVDSCIPHIPVMTDEKGHTYHTISTTNWKPYSWSINNVAIAEVMHTALAYWQAGRQEEAYELMKGVMMDNMYTGASPLNFGQISHFDAARNECYRDFADPVGVWSRALTEGLWGIRPNLLEGVVEIIPGFPAAWNEASVNLPDLSYSYRQSADTVAYDIENRYPEGTSVKMVLPGAGIRKILLNGKETAYSTVPGSVGFPRVTFDAGDGRRMEVRLVKCAAPEFAATGKVRREGPVTFEEYASDNLSYWKPSVAAVERPRFAGNGFDNVLPGKCRTVDISKAYNAKVAEIFNQEYLSPRPSVTTLQIPKQGIGEWCHPKLTAEVNDSVLRAVLKSGKGILDTEIGIPFRMASDGDNVMFTSLWDNYPDSASVALSGKATNIYVVLAGTTNHMQTDVENGVLRVNYTDGASSE